VKAFVDASDKKPLLILNIYLSHVNYATAGDDFTKALKMPSLEVGYRRLKTSQFSAMLSGVCHFQRSIHGHLNQSGACTNMALLSSPESDLNLFLESPLLYAICCVHDVLQRHKMHLNLLIHPDSNK
jgi:hypothetical protein